MHPLPNIHQMQKSQSGVATVSGDAAVGSKYIQEHDEVYANWVHKEFFKNGFWNAIDLSNQDVRGAKWLHGPQTV